MDLKDKTAIRVAREEAELSRADFAAECKLPVGFVARLEMGKPVAVTPKIALRICRVLNVPSRRLWQESEP